MEGKIRGVILCLQRYKVPVKWDEQDAQIKIWVNINEANIIQKQITREMLKELQQMEQEENSDVKAVFIEEENPGKYVITLFLEYANKRSIKINEKPIHNPQKEQLSEQNQYYNSKKHILANTKINNMKEYNNIWIAKDENGNKHIKWKPSMFTLTTTKKNNKGEKKQYSSFFALIPKELDKNMEWGDSIYFYEHFEKVCISKEKPPSSVTYKEIKIAYPHKEEGHDVSRRITLPKKFWDINEYSSVNLILWSKQDYIFPENPLITIDIVDILPDNLSRNVMDLIDKLVFELYPDNNLQQKQLKEKLIKYIVQHVSNSSVGDIWFELNPGDVKKNILDIKNSVLMMK